MRVRTLHLSDLYLDDLKDSLFLSDTRMDEIDREVEGHPDPDGHGLLDSLNHVVGQGFITCQLYMAQVILQNGGKECRALGPKHAESGLPVARIIHAAGNYMKHSAEGEPAKDTKDVLRTLGLWRNEDGWERAADYAMVNALYKLVGEPMRVSRLLPLLSDWRDEVVARQVSRSTMPG